MSKKPREIYTYALAVFESIFPRISNGIGDEKPKLVGPSSGANSAFQYAGNQNEFGGYYKVVPMNVLQLITNSTGTGHRFNITLDPSFVYVELDPLSVSPEVITYFRDNAVRSIVTGEDSEARATKIEELEGMERFFIGMMDGFSREEIESDGVNKRPRNVLQYVLPGELFANLVSEMDTVSIFIINDLANFNESDMFKIFGGSFSRLNEFDVSQRSRTLTQLGIIPTAEFLSQRNLSSPSTQVSLLRSFISNTGLYAFNTSLGRFNTPYQPGRSEEGRNNSRDNENERLEQIIDDMRKFGQQGPTSSPRDPSIRSMMGKLTVHFGEEFTKMYGANIEGNNQDVFNELINEVNDYYDSNTLESQMFSWTLYKTVEHSLANTLGGDEVGTTGLPGLNDTSVDAMRNAILFDLILSNQYPDVYSRLSSASDDEFDAILQEATNAVSNDYDLNIEPEAYTAGLNQFSDAVSAMYDAIENETNLIRSEYDLDDLGITDFSEHGEVMQVKASQILAGQGMENLRVPLSGHAPGLVLKGHVDGIQVSSSVGDSTYEKKVTVTGQGLELPLKRQIIFFDNLNPDRMLTLNILNYGIKTSTPIGAAIDVMELFASDYIEIKEADSDEVYVESHHAKNYRYFLDKQGSLMVRGSLAHREPLDEDNKPMLYTPLHYIHNGFLHVIREIFDEVRLEEKVQNQLTQGLEQNNLYAVLTSILSSSSPYAWFVDEYGFIKVRYENSSAAYTTSTIVSPIIEDEHIISISTSTSEERVFTITEVTPQALSLGMPSEGYITGVFGRSISPSVSESYALYSVANFNPKDPEVISLLSKALSVFDSEVTTAFNDVHSSRTGAIDSIYNIPNQPIPIPPPPPATDIPLDIPLDIDMGPDEDVYAPNQEQNTTTEVDMNKAKAATEDVPLDDPEDSDYPNLDWDVEKSRDTAYLEEELRYRQELLFARYAQLYPDEPEPFVTDTFRSASVQDALLAEGTKTKASSLTSYHTQIPVLAFDLAFRRPGSPWGDTSLFDKAGEIGYELGLEWGGFWTMDVEGIVDPPHFQVPNYRGQLRTGNPINWPPLPEWANDPGMPERRPGLPIDFAISDDKKGSKAGEDTDVGAKRQPQSSSSSGTGTDDFDNEPEAINLANLVFSEQPVGLSDSSRTSSNYDVDHRLLSGSLTDSINAPLNSSGIELTGTGENRYRRMLATLAINGARPDNIVELATGDSEQARRVRNILENSGIHVKEKDLQSFDSSALVLNTTQSRQLPYQGFELQDTVPEQISADLFRYGLRLYRLQDYYLTSIFFTRFRADTIRKLHELPIRSANVTILGKPSFKRGNTTLVTTKEIEDRRSNYINIGALLTLNDLGSDRDSLIFNADDVIREGLSPIYNYPFGGAGSVSEGSIRQHFQDAFSFILGESSNEPVSTSGYVPLHGIYSVGGAVSEYLSALATAAAKAHTSSYLSVHEKRLEDALLGVITEVYGSDYTFSDANNIVNLLSPQTYHAYQYYIDSVNHSWNFGASFRTTLNLDFGRPAVLCVIPKQIQRQRFGVDYDSMHVVGWLLTHSPYMLYNERGVKYEDVYEDHALYRFTVAQRKKENEFYTNTERYSIELALEKIRRKLLYPEIYGSIY